MLGKRKKCAKGEGVPIVGIHGRGGGNCASIVQKCTTVFRVVLLVREEEYNGAKAAVACLLKQVQLKISYGI